MRVIEVNTGPAQVAMFQGRRMALKTGCSACCSSSSRHGNSVKRSLCPEPSPRPSPPPRGCEPRRARRGRRSRRASHPRGSTNSPRLCCRRVSQTLQHSPAQPPEPPPRSRKARAPGHEDCALMWIEWRLRVAALRRARSLQCRLQEVSPLRLVGNAARSPSTIKTRAGRDPCRTKKRRLSNVN